MNRIDVKYLEEINKESAFEKIVFKLDKQTKHTPQYNLRKELQNPQEQTLTGIGN